jgi:hypothetical protein
MFITFLLVFYLIINLFLLYNFCLVILYLLKPKREILFNLLITLSKKHDDFNKNTFLKIYIITVIGLLLAYYIYDVYYLHLNKNFIKILGNGFFLAPLILLIINNQKYIIENFINTFRIKYENNEKIILDPNSQRIKNNIIELVKNINIIEQYNDLNQKWKSFNEIVNFAIESRLNFERLNNQSLLIVSILLLLGYTSLLFDNIFFSISFLIVSFLILINRVLILGIRSLLKYYCIGRESLIMLDKINDITKKEMENSFNKLKQFDEL